MACDGSKRSQLSSIPPRKINVQKFAEARASELDSLYSIVSSRLNKNFRSRRNKRRRTTAHDNQASRKRSGKRRKLGIIDQNNALDLEKGEKKVSRRIRRRIELKKNPTSGFSTSGDGTKRLRTHVWHAKRFTMKKLWGFYLPLGLQGRGRGSRALLKWFKQGVVVHDASYYIAVHLEGPEDSLLSILRMVLEPSPSFESEDSPHSVLSGTVYGRAMLHHVGAPFSQTIAPVTYMWKPSHEQQREGNGNHDNAVGCNEPYKIECASCFRQLWLWIHASAFGEAYDALKLACQKQMSDTGALINCFSLEGQLGTLELIGSKAFQVLQKTLHPVNGIPNNSWQLNRCLVSELNDDSQNKGCFVLENDEQISSSAILSLVVKDPRLPSHKSISDNSEELFSSSCSKLEGHCFSNNGNIWDTTNGISPPMEENVLCMEKHDHRMNFLCLDDKKSGTLNTSNKVQCSRSCPILLLKNENKKGSPIGWTAIVPLSWVRVFWTSIVSKGAHAIGLREKHWIACDTGLPYFPSDFPDCNAYSSFMATEAAASDQKAELCPATVRPLRVPIPSPWTIVHNTVNKVAMGEQDAKFSSEKNVVDNNSLSETCQRSDMISYISHGNSFDGTVPRTSHAVTYFMNQIHGDHLPLFPQLPNQRRSFMKLRKNESMLGQDQNDITKIYYDYKLCFLRVLLHAYKEGVFEEGAVVCAPSLADVSLWTSSSVSNDVGLQIPQSSVRSYFKELSSGKWELQVPEDPPSRESHRWPIGFVTTGFVRGSKKPTAGAFCDAVLLARLREEQWNKMLVKRRRKGIYVLVRNLRSSVYRLALATIVLEKQEDDVNFM